MNLPRCWLCSYLLFVCSRSLSTFSINRKTLTQHPPCTHTYTHTKPFHTHTHTHRCALICLIKLHPDRAFNHSQFSNHSLAHSRAKQTNVNTDAVLHKCEWQYVCVCTLASSGTTQTNTQEHTYTHKHAHTHFTYSSIYIELTLHAQAESLSTLASALSYLALAASANRAFNLFGNALMQKAALLSTQEVHGNNEHKVQHTFQIKQKIILWQKH